MLQPRLLPLGNGFAMGECLPDRGLICDICLKQRTLCFAIGGPSSRGGRRSLWAGTSTSLHSLIFNP